MNVIEVQENLKDFSEQQLMNEMQNPSGFAPQYLVLSELQRRKRIRDSYNQARAAQQPTVAQEVVNSAGVPQGGVMDMAQAMAPKSSMAQNTGVMAMRSGGVVEKQVGGDFFDMLSDEEKRRIMQRELVETSGRMRRLNEDRDLVGIAMDSSRITRPEYREFYAAPGMSDFRYSYMDTVPDRAFTARQEERERLGERAADIAPVIPQVAGMTDAEIRSAGIRGAVDAVTDPSSYIDPAVSAARVMTGAANRGIDAMVDTSKSAADNVYDAIYGFGYDNQEGIEAALQTGKDIAEAGISAAQTGLGSIREGLTNPDAVVPSPDDTVLMRGAKTLTGGIQTGLGALGDLAMAPLEIGRDIGEYLGSPADDPTLPSYMEAIGTRMDAAKQRRAVEAGQADRLAEARRILAAREDGDEETVERKAPTAPAAPAAAPTGVAPVADAQQGVPGERQIPPLPAAPRSGASVAPLSPIEERLVQMEEDRAKQREADKYLALAQAGFTLMGSDKPLGEAVGEAGLAGLKAMRGAESAYQKDVASILNARAKAQGSTVRKPTDPLEYLKLASQAEKRAIDIQQLLSGPNAALMDPAQKARLEQELIDVKNEARNYRIFGGAPRVDRRVS